MIYFYLFLFYLFLCDIILFSIEIKYDKFINLPQIISGATLHLSLERNVEGRIDEGLKEPEQVLPIFRNLLPIFNIALHIRPKKYSVQ